MKAPAFQLYASDFLVDTLDWSATQVGIYFRLLMYEWVNGSIPNDCIRMARISGIDVGNFKKCYLQDIEKKFTVNSGGELINARLEKTRQEQDNYRKSQSESGKRGAEKRWKKDSEPNSDPIDEPNSENIALQSSPPTLKKEKYIKRNSTEKILLSDGVKEVLDLLNEKRDELVGKKVKAITTDKQIKARLTDKIKPRTVYECLRVVDVKALHVKEGKLDIEYFQPSTLFGKDNFEKYLNQTELMR